MKILITGGTVFISRCLAEYFLEKGNEVFVLNRGTHEIPEGAQLIKADRYNIGSALEGMSFDAVIAVNTYDENDMSELLRSLSGNTLFKKTWRFNQFVFISSSAVYPEVNVQPFTENQSTGWNKIWKDYGLNKAGAENILRRNFKNAYILRPSYFYGAGNNLYREAFVFECAEKDRPFYLPGNGEMKLQFYSAGDLCVFVEKLLSEKPSEKIFNLGNPETVSVKEWVSLCYKACGSSEPEFVNVSADVPQRNYFPFYDYEYELDVRREMNFCKPVENLKEGLFASYEWFKNHREEVQKKDYIKFIDENIR